MTGKITVEYLQRYIRARDHNPSAKTDYFLKLIEEVGELSHAIWEGRPPAEGADFKGSVEEELWDVIYYVLAIANCYEIDLEKWIPVKEQLNQEKYHYPEALRFDPAGPAPMIPLDPLWRAAPCLESAQAVLSEGEYAELRQIPAQEQEEQLCALLTRPIDRFTPVNEAYFRWKWSMVIHRYFGDKPIALLEVASGDADMIPQALSRSNPGSAYYAANMNEALNRSLLRKTEGLNLDFHLIADDAARITEYIAPDTVDVIAFQHGVNDVLQAILCGEYGVDTIHTDWMETLPEMIRILKKETAEGTFAAKVQEPFLTLIHSLCATLKKGGLILIHHYMFQLDLDWGYPPELFENLVPLVRRWFSGEPGLEEIEAGGYDGQWWLILRKR